MLFRPGSIVPGRNPPIAVVAGRSRSPQHRLLPLFHRLFHLRPLVRPLLQSSFSAAAIRLFARISSCTLRLTNWAVCNSNCTNSRCTSYWRSNGRSPILRRITFLCEVLGFPQLFLPSKIEISLLLVLRSLISVSVSFLDTG